MKEKQTDSLKIFKSAPISQAVLKKHNSCHGNYDDSINLQSGRYIFIGQTKDAFMIAAFPLVTPVFLHFMAVGTVFGIGGTSMISRAMGKGERNMPKRYVLFVCGAV